MVLESCWQRAEGTGKGSNRFSAWGACSDLWHFCSHRCTGAGAQRVPGTIRLPEESQIGPWGGPHGLRRMAGAWRHSRRGSRCGGLPEIPCLACQVLIYQGPLYQPLHFPGGCTGKTGHLWVNLVLLPCLWFLSMGAHGHKMPPSSRHSGPEFGEHALTRRPFQCHGRLVYPALPSPLL